MYSGQAPKSKALMQAHGKELCQFTLGCLPLPCVACQGPSEVQGDPAEKVPVYLLNSTHGIVLNVFDLSNAVIYRRQDW